MTSSNSRFSTEIRSWITRLVGFQLGLAWPAGTDAAAQTGQRRTAADQARRAIAQLCQFDLNLTFSRIRPLREDIQDDQCPVHDLCIQNLLHVAHLCRCELIITDNAGSSEFRDSLLQLVQLSLAEISAGMDLLPALDEHFQRDSSGSCNQFL